MGGAGGSFGALLGGVLADADWRWVLFVNVPIAVLLAAFAERFVAEGRHARAPLVPLRILRSRQTIGANAVIFALGAGAFAMWFFVSLYLQEVLGYSALRAGLAFLPMSLSIVVAATLASRL